MPRTQFGRLVCVGLVWALTATEAAAQNAGMGGTFDLIASTATEVRTVFRDAHAITRKEVNGYLETVLYDGRGEPVVSLRRDPKQPYVEVGAAGGGWRHRVTLAEDIFYAPDWNNAQAYLLWRDAHAVGHSLAAAALPPIVFEGKLLRIKAARDEEQRRGKPLDVDEETQSVQTRFPKYVALATKRPSRTNLRTDGSYAAFTARLQSVDGVTLGYIRYFPKDRAISWTFTTGERGVAREDKVAGGFKFKPNMAWANVQAVWFHENPPKKPVPAPAAFASGTLPACGAAKPAPAPARKAESSLKERIVSWFGGLRFLPSVEAFAGPSARSKPSIPAPPQFLRHALGVTSRTQEPPCDGQSDGCTGLHWLDGTIFRQCCDRHDICFEKDCQEGPCTRWSWIKFWDRWECTGCNIYAVLCFATFGNWGEPPEADSGGREPGHNWCWSDWDCPDGYICEWDGTCRSWFF